jgi:hypothetical protein
MIEIVIGLLGKIALLYTKSVATQVYARKFLYEWLSLCFCLILAGALILYYQSYSGTVVSTSGPTSNTLYLNNNFTSITIYSTTNSVLKGYVGNSVTTLLIAINDTPTIASGIGVTDLPGSVTSTLVVPEGDYYQYNYTQASFTLVKVRT